MLVDMLVDMGGFLSGRSSEQIGVGSGADQQDFCIRDKIDQEPVRLDMAFPNAAPFAGQSVGTISGGRSAQLGEQFDRRNEIIDILATALPALKVVAKLLALSDTAHRASS